MENRLWFNLAANTNQQMAMANRVSTGGYTPPPTRGNPNTTLITQGRSNTNTGGVVYTDCTKCVNGSARGNRVTNGDCTTLGPGWMAADPNNQGFWIDPCVQQSVSGCMDPLATNFDPSATSDNGTCSYAPTQSVTCYECVNGVATGKSYLNTTTCPKKSETTDPDPCKQAGPVLEDDCYDCVNQTMNRVARGSCPDAKDIMVSPVDPTTGLSDPPCPKSILGCTDPTSETYNPDATEDDGSCVYPEPAPSEIEEIAEQAENQAGFGDNKMILYLMGGLIIYLLLRGNKS